MRNTRKHTLTASLVALLAAAPAVAQQTGSDQQQSQQSQQSQTTEQAQTQPAERQMPQAATPQGHGTSDVATVDTPQGEVGAEQGEKADRQGRMVMLDVEGFSQTIYERGFRQGYLSGAADARERFMAEMQRRQAAREGLAAQQDRMESAMGGQLRGTPRAGAEPRQGMAGEQAQTAQNATGDAQQQTRGDLGQQTAAGERGTVIVLPPGVTPEMFVQQLIENNEATQQGG